MERAAARQYWEPLAHIRRDLRALLVGGDVGSVDDFTPFGERRTDDETAIPGDIAVLKQLIPPT